MRKRRKVSAQSLYLLLVFVFCYTAQTGLAEEKARGNNLFANPGFEEGVVSWEVVPGEGEVTAVKDERFKGTSSLRLSLNKKGRVTVSSPPVAVEGDSFYLFSLRYKAEGFENYQAGAVSAKIQWLDIDDKEISYPNRTCRWKSNILFPDRPADWGLAVILTKSPSNAGKASLTISLSREKTNGTSTIWLDQIEFTPYSPPVLPEKARKYYYRAVDLPRRQDKGMALAKDAKSSYGAAVKASPGKATPTAMAYGPYTTEPPPGLYRCVFRIRAERIEETTKPVVALTIGNDSTANYGNHLAQRFLYPDDFPDDNYHEFNVEFARPRGGGISFVVEWQGNGTVYEEGIELIEEKAFSSREEEFNFW